MTPHDALESAGTQATLCPVEAESRNAAAALADTLQRALKLYAGGDRNSAESLCRQILAIDSRHAGALHLLGMVEYMRQNYQRAADLIQQAIDIDAGRAAYYMDLGLVFRAMGNLRKAAQSYIHSLALNPQSAETYVNLGRVFQEGQQFDDAVACYRQALTLKPGLIGAHDNLGNVLRKMRCFDEALACHRKALALDPDRAATHYNLASLLSELGEFDQALQHCNRSLALQIDNPARVLFLQALIELVQGDFSAGWNHYEQRWGNPDHDTPARNYAQPLWNGEKLSQGDLFIWGEQGIGDEIMFAGILPDVVRTGNRCVLECDSRLHPLFARSFPAIVVVSRPAEKNAIDCAAHIPSGSLPRLFRSTHAAFGDTPSSYLVADQVRRNSFRAAYDDGRPLVGLAWKTKSTKSGHLRSIDLAGFAPYLCGHDMRVVNLQYGDAEELAAEAQAAGVPLVIDRGVDQFTDIDTFAAQIAAMDLVVTIDNSTAHLAGALGVPVWLLLPFVPDWRWQLNRQDSPWYPNLRIFRQQSVGDWKPVLEQVQAALQQFKSCTSETR